MSRRRHVHNGETFQSVAGLRPSAVSIIKRREVGPLLLKAQAVIKAYIQAANCGVLVFDQDDQPAENPPCRKLFFFCSLCRQYNHHFGQDGNEREYPCAGMQDEGIAEARRRGGSFIYMCELGFVYWISPIYSGGRYAGSLVAGGILPPERQETVEKIALLSGGQLSRETVGEQLADIPEKTHEEIKALARLLYLCTERISGNTGDYDEIARRITQRESKTKVRSFPVKDISLRESSEPVYPLDKERMLLAALRRGDSETGRKILNELLKIVLISNPGNFEFIRLRAIELVVLLSRAAAPNVSGDGDILEMNNRYLKKIQGCETLEELTGNLHLIIERMARQIFSFKGVRHASALRKAERYIWENYTRKISLQEIADVSGLSPPYFSTVFKEEMGENFSTCLNRLRVEKAVSLMTETSLSLNEIAAASGFEDQSWFSKIFRAYTGMSPGKYRGGGINNISGKGDEGR